MSRCGKSGAGAAEKTPTGGVYRPRNPRASPLYQCADRHLADLAIGMLSGFSMERELKAGLLKALPLQGFPLNRNLVVVSRKDGPTSLAARSFLEFAAAYCEKHAPPGSARGARRALT